jgi:hypothetical protein
MTAALIDLGLDPSRIHLIDIPYTANATVRAALEGLGIPGTNFAPASYSLDQPYARYQRARVQAMADRVRDSLGPEETLLVLDDGSYFIEAMSCFAEPLGRARVVEQTTRGLIKIAADPAIADTAARVTIVDVASSAPKCRWEGPWIGEAVARSLRRSLGAEVLDGDDRCLILGYGTIGRAVGTSLVRDLGVDPARVSVLDPGLPAQAAARADGFASWERAQPERLRFKLVVGCSGQTSFTIGDRVYLDDGAVLASASSGSSELSREQFVELADTYPDDDVFVVDGATLASRSLHEPIDLNLVDRRVRFLNGSFPVNFDGRVNCVPPAQIQVTHTLMVGAAIQAVESEGRGVVPLAGDLCDWVDRTYGAMLEAGTAAVAVDRVE